MCAVVVLLKPSCDLPCFGLLVLDLLLTTECSEIKILTGGGLSFKKFRHLLPLCLYALQKLSLDVKSGHM